MNKASAAYTLLNWLFRSKVVKEPDPAKLALKEVRWLMDRKNYQEALKKLEETNKRYPDLVKAVPFYRGEILESMAEERERHKSVESSQSKNNSRGPELR